MNIQNLTPHPIVILTDDPNGEVTGLAGKGRPVEGKFRVVKTLNPLRAKGEEARATQNDQDVNTFKIEDVDVKVVRTIFGAPVGLPEPVAGTFLVVSVITAQAAKAAGRSVEDLLLTTDPVRSADGKIIGCRGFAVL